MHTLFVIIMHSLALFHANNIDLSQKDAIYIPKNNEPNAHDIENIYKLAKNVLNARNAHKKSRSKYVYMPYLFLPVADKFCLQKEIKISDHLLKEGLFSKLAYIISWSNVRDNMSYGNKRDRYARFAKEPPLMSRILLSISTVFQLSENVIDQLDIFFDTQNGHMGNLYEAEFFYRNEKLYKVELRYKKGIYQIIYKYAFEENSWKCKEIIKKRDFLFGVNIML